VFVCGGGGGGEKKKKITKFTFNHIADTFIHSDVQMRRITEAFRPSREQQNTSAMASLYTSTVHVASLLAH